MPCDSSYMEADDREVQLSRVVACLDEIETGRKIRREDWDGYHPHVYNQHLSTTTADRLVSQLCEWCQSHDVTKQSLELQIWWRDHQDADRRRVKRAIDREKDTVARRKALAKLTPYERKLLGIKV